jgi:PDZ domain-containing protein
MKRELISLHTLQIHLGRNVMTLGASWLIVLPVSIWAIGALYVPITAPFLTPLETWSVTTAIVLLSAVCLIAHGWAHLRAARRANSDVPAHLPLYLPGDAAQVWPAAVTTRQETLIAAAGPALNLLLAGLAYLVWNVQLNPTLNVISLFLVSFNGSLAVVNLAPFFPLDGGRLVRAIGWGLLARPAWATRFGWRLGVLFALMLAAWGVILIAQQARFSWPTGLGTLCMAGLILTPLIVQPAWQWNRPEPPAPARWSIILVRGPLAGLLIFTLLSLTISLVPTNHGLEAPGVALDVEPMVEVPAEHRYPSTGHFLLTTVFSQTPITVGEWLLGQMSPVINLVPPEQIVPADTTTQEMALRNFRMLDDSQVAAVAVGLRLAGYEVTINGLGARVLSVLAESPATGILQPGDVIIELNNETINDVAGLIARLKAHTAPDTVQLQIERNDQSLELAVGLMPPAEPGQPPRIGITVEEAGFETDLPFPVQIKPQKISGGPSAGLMFTLTVYDLVTPGDLTGGHTIAGTGTINLDGTVGPIGGVHQKVAAAEYTGAEYFLSPPENYDDAHSVARQITVVKVASAAEAIDFLRSLPPLN